MRTLLAALFLAVPAAANHIPGGPAAGVVPAPEPPHGRVAEYETNLRLSTRIWKGKFEPAAELSHRWQEETGAPFRWLSGGGFYRAHKNLWVGALYRLQVGTRHNNDWIEDSNGQWSWRDTSQRAEHLFLLDATPRFQLDFLPGENWIFAGKIQYQRNTFSTEQTLRLVPELSYFWLSGLAPVATFALRNELNYALNFGAKGLYERWHYLVALWHPAPGASVGPSIGIRDMTWTTSQDAQASGGTYRVKHKSYVLGLDASFRFK